MFAKDLNKTTLGNARYYITQSFVFDASHCLRPDDVRWLDEGGRHLSETMIKCFSNHGHTYRLHLTWQGYPTDARPMIWPFGHLRTFARELVNSCDHHNLNEVFTWPTTLENLANWFFKRLQAYNDSSIRIHRVELWEGDNNRVTVEGE